MKNNLKRWIAIMIAVTLTVGCLPRNLQRKIGAQSEVKAEETINDPRIVEDSSMIAYQKVTWDCVWFGSYPQTEIVDKAETCGTYSNEDWGSSTDYEVNASVYSALQNATGWNNNGDITLNGTRYRRIKEADATYGIIESSIRYDWPDFDTYHYFRYEPVKWRVLDKDGSTALLLADKALDCQKYYIVDEPVTWATSTIRSWLNGYGAASNDKGVDYSNKNFIDAAFTSAQQGGILTSDLTNADGIVNETEGGNDTSDKLFFLSETDVYTDAANSYGFVYSENTNDEARRCKSSTYAKAMGAYVSDDPSYAGNCDWWLRTPAYYMSDVVGVSEQGYVDQDYGFDVYYADSGVRPALKLNLASSDLYSYAGTVCSDEMKEGGGSSSGGEDEEDHVVVVSLGDSYSSGEGIETFYGQGKDLSERVEDEDWLAHRSEYSWPGLLEVDGVEGTMKDYRDTDTSGDYKCKWYFGAVSGAETKHFYKSPQPKKYTKFFAPFLCYTGTHYMPRQLGIFDKIFDPVDYVTLTIGGNDVEFVNIVTTAALKSSYYGTKTEKLKDDLNRLWKNVDNTNEDIKDVYKKIRAKAPTADILVVGYPQLLDEQIPIINLEESWLVNKSVSNFNMELRKNVESMNDPKMHFVDVESEFFGHEAFSKEPWLNGILPVQPQDLDDNVLVSSYSMHPNKTGAEKYAECVNEKIEEIESK